MKRLYCHPECRNPECEECADCWKTGGNPALGFVCPFPFPPFIAFPSGEAVCACRVTSEPEPCEHGAIKMENARQLRRITSP